MKGLEKIKNLCQELRIVVLIFGKMTLVKKKLAEKAQKALYALYNKTRNLNIERR
jgi:hypothetical protein